MKTRCLSLFFYSFIVLSLNGQTNFWIKDSLDKKPIYAAKLVENGKVIATSDQEGKISFFGAESSTYTIQSLSYAPLSFSFKLIKDTFFLSRAHISLSGTTISPTNAKTMIEEAFQKVLENHTPISFIKTARIERNL